MTKSVVVEHPKGVYTRIMPGTQAMIYYEAAVKGDWGTKSNPGQAANFKPHMEMLHRNYLKEMGITHEQYLESPRRFK